MTEYNFELDQYYRLLTDYGALALIVVQLLPAGASTFHFETWKEQNDITNGELVVVCISMQDVTRQVIERWSKSDHLTVDIKTPFNREYFRLFTSSIWIAFFQVILPMINFYSVYVGVKDVVRIWRTSSRQMPPQKVSARKMSLFILTIEATSCTVLGMSLILGTYGPQMLPFLFHRAMFSGLIAPSLVTTLVLGLHLREQVRMTRNEERRVVLTHYRYRIAACAVFFVVLDEVAYPLLHLMDSLTLRVGMLVFLFLFVLCTTQLGFAIFFARQTKILAKVVSVYLKGARHSVDQLRGVKSLQRLNFWGHAAASTMIVHSTMVLTYTILLAVAATTSKFSLRSNSLYFIFHFATMLSRTAISYSHISAVSQSSCKREQVALMKAWRGVSATVGVCSASSSTNGRPPSTESSSDHRQSELMTLPDRDIDELEERAVALARVLEEEGFA